VTSASASTFAGGTTATNTWTRAASGTGGGTGVWTMLRRSRRQNARRELFAGLVLLLESGIPLVEALGLMARSPARSRSTRRLLASLVTSLTGGDSLSQAMAAAPDWFTPIEIAKVQAGERAGTLVHVLSGMRDQQARLETLAAKLVGAIAYPMVVLSLGAAVALFLGTRTLPELAGMLSEGGLPVPRLTQSVIHAAAVASHPATVVGSMAALVLAVWTLWWLRKRLSDRLARLTPAAVRTAVLSELLASLADLMKVGIPAVEAMRLVAPSTAAPGLGPALSAAAEAIEQGATISESLADSHWFDEELRRLVWVGENGGELPGTLAALAERLSARAARQTQRLAAVVEPAAILAISVLVGVLVLAATLPLVRMRDLVQ
jgi:general secretion pathway protein F